jgi:DNA-binding NarL/FixJ family response regulator
MSLPQSLGQLGDASIALEDERVVVGLAAEALREACPRGLALAYTIRGHPACGLGAVAALGDVVPDIQRFRRVYASSAQLYYDRWAVDPKQRGRWQDLPATWFRGSQFYPVFHPYGWMGRTLACLGGRPLACAGVLLPEGAPPLREAERARLLATALQTLGPLRVTALLSQALPALDGVEQLLNTRGEVAFLLSGAGQVLAGSAAGRRALESWPGLKELLAESVRGARHQARSLTSPAHDCEVYVSPCSPRGSAAGYIAVVGAPRPPGRGRVTPREAELIEWLEQGLTNAGIATRMRLAEPTVKTMLERLYRKAGVRGRVALLYWARGRQALN